MELLTFAEAWRWVQIGACLAFGAGMVIIPVRLLLGIGALLEDGSSPPIDIPEPHCSKCCPHEEDYEEDG
jgi:hypothetical protein